MKFYIVINGEQKGPFDINELRAQGITKDTLVWKEGYAGWVKAESVPELAGLFTTPPQFDAQFSSPRYAMGGESMGVMPKTWLVESIIACVLCCLPLGIAALVNAADVESCYRVGRYSEAVRKSQNAKNWLIWSVVACVLGWVCLIGICVILGISFANMYH